jgi:hypothetical protein
LLIKVDATSDDEDDQAIFGALLIFFLFSAPLLLISLTFWDFLRSRCFAESIDESSDDDEPATKAVDLESGSKSNSTRSLSADRPPDKLEHEPKTLDGPRHQAGSAAQ